MTKPRPATLPLRVLQVIQERGLWSPGHTVAVAVSGGVDSVALLDVLHRTQAAHGATLTVHTVHHGLREDADEDVTLVQAIAAERGLPCAVTRLALSPGPGLMERARAARRAAWRALPVDRVALAHHQDDQAETVLQRLLRGSGSRGLSGMRPLDSRLNPHGGPSLCRPLLFESKAMIRSYAEHNHLPWRDDPSNPSSERGHLRALAPDLERIRPGYARGLARSARLLAEDDALLASLAAEAAQRCAVEGGRLSLVALRREPRALALRVLLRWADQTGHPVSADRLEAVLGTTLHAGVIQLGGGWMVVVRRGDATLVAPQP